MAEIGIATLAESTLVAVEASARCRDDTGIIYVSFDSEFQMIATMTLGVKF